MRSSKTGKPLFSKTDEKEVIDIVKGFKKKSADCNDNEMSLHQKRKKLTLWDPISKNL